MIHLMLTEDQFNTISYDIEKSITELVYAAQATDKRVVDDVLTDAIEDRQILKDEIWAQRKSN